MCPHDLNALSAAVRTGRAQLLAPVRDAKTIHDGAKELADLLSSRPNHPLLERKDVYYLLNQVPRLGWKKLDQMTRRRSDLDWFPSVYRPWGECAPRQREAVIRRLRDLAARGGA